MMQKSSLSANTLFHFTSCLDDLENILTQEFYPHFCLEELHALYPEEMPSSKVHYSAIPMVSFCDIPLSQIRNHIKFYGNYCIGLKKEWGIRKTINPVMYFHEHSDYCQNMKIMFLKTHRGIKLLDELEKKDKAFGEFGKIIHGIFSYDTTTLGNYLLKLSFQSKPYKGKLWRKNRFINNVNFYDEKEWRFVPSIPTLVMNKLPIDLSEKEFHNPEIREKYNEILRKCCKLSFRPNDIKYIIVENDKEILRMMSRIDEIKVKYSRKEKGLLKSRLISIQQILEDF